MCTVRRWHQVRGSHFPAERLEERCTKHRFSSVVFNHGCSIIQYLTVMKSHRNPSVQSMNEIHDPLAYAPLPGTNPNSDVVQIMHWCPSEIWPENHSHAFRSLKIANLSLMTEFGKQQANWHAVMQVLYSLCNILPSHLEWSGGTRGAERAPLCNGMVEQAWW